MSSQNLNKKRPDHSAFERKEKVTKKVGYMCETDFRFELGSSKNASQIFGSLESLKKHKSCWKSCGIIEVEITKKKIIN